MQLNTSLVVKLEPFPLWAPESKVTGVGLQVALVLPNGISSGFL